MRRNFLMVAALTALTACGGGGAASVPAAQPTVRSEAGGLDTHTVNDGVVMYTEGGELVVRPGAAPNGVGSASRPGGGGTTAATTVSGTSGAATKEPAAGTGLEGGIAITPGETGSSSTGQAQVDTAQMRTEAETISKLVVSTVACCDMPDAVPIAERIGQIEGGEELRSLVERADEMFEDPSGVRFKAIVERVIFPSPAVRAAYCKNAVQSETCALVEARIANTTGQVGQRVWTLYVIETDGKWVVSRRSMCSLLYKLSLRCPNFTGNELLDWLSD